MWTCLVWAERSTPDSLGVPSHRFNSTTGEQKFKGTTQTIYTDSEPPSRLPKSLMPSAKLRSAPPSFYVFGVIRSGIDPQPPTPRADALTAICYAGAVETRIGFDDM